jgi:hypothetical protein
MVFSDPSGNWSLSYQTWTPPSCTNYGCGGAREMYIASLSLPTSAPAPVGLPTQRIYGQDAIGTAIAISEAGFPTAGSAKGVVLACSDYFADALAGGPLAAQLGGPLLITPGASQSSQIDPRVLAEIERVLPPGGTVDILGGDLALSPNIDATLAAYGADPTATPIYRQDLFGTSAAVATTFFPDALASGVFMATGGRVGPILLVNPSLPLPSTIQAYLSHTTTLAGGYVFGGPLAIPDSVAAAF